ncbi:acetyl-CoA synthetase-like protein [Xylaria sp. CBS 124048]|nr:acetyl-CoA synthetase-like protein [Xylaria sp. CBS 124048]
MEPSAVLKNGRLYPVVIDELARDDPHRPWASIPRDDDDLSKGYEDIDYEVLANAVNRLAWVIDSAVGKSGTFETIAYLGANDLRYYMMQMAAIKTGTVVLFSAHSNSVDVHASLMEKLDCKFVFSSADIKVDDILAARPMMHTIVPDLNDLLDLKFRSEYYPYTKTYEEAAQDPYMYIHTSGTTGEPKPVVHNHAIVHTAIALSYLPDVEGRPHAESFVRPGLGTRVLLTVVPYHSSSSLLGPILSILGGGVLVTPYRSGYLYRSEAILDIIMYSKITHSVLAPYVMEAAARKPNLDKYLKNVQQIWYGGGEVSRQAQETWSKYTRVYDRWGATELGLVPQLVPDPGDYEYIYFDMEYSGLEFREVNLDDYSNGSDSAKICEMVLTWTPKSAPYSAWYLRQSTKLKSGPPYPNHYIGDLWSPHPDPKKSRYAWRFVGRTDDVITLAAGTNVNTGNIERELNSHHLVKKALIIGNMRLQPLALIELVPDAHPEAMSEVWESVLAPLNAKVPSDARIARTHLLQIPESGFVTTGKGTVSKVKSERKFAKEIEEIYQKFGDVYHSQGRGG